MDILDALKQLYTSHSGWGLTHLVAANAALFFGTLVIAMRKGTPRHKLAGWFYVTTMLITNGSSFWLNNFGGFSVFHAFAIFSLVTVAVGFYQVANKRKGWLIRHVGWMSGSVVGLYAALAAEISVRLFPAQVFWWVVMVASLAVGIVGVYLILRFQAKKLPTYFSE